MAYIIAINDPPVSGEADCITGTITVDAAAPVTSTVSFDPAAQAAAVPAKDQKLSTACSSTTGLGAGTLVEITGIGSGSTTLRTLLRAVGSAPLSVTIHHLPPAIANATLTPCAFVLTGGTPRKVHLINLTSRTEYTWVEGMPVGSMLKRDSSGVATFVTSLGITPVYGGFYLSQGVLDAGSEWVFAVHV